MQNHPGRLPGLNTPIAPPLLAWYHQNRRRLPFREDPTPYHVWVSEIMLQQTQVKTVLPYYERFMAALPTVAALANASESLLQQLWQGLGYYSRARNLQRAAGLIMANHGGRLPAGYNELLALPGIGPYTAGAIASIAFGLPAIAVDGNVLRVFSRLLNCHADIGAPATQKQLSAQVAAQQPAACPGDYNQALMELGALVCTSASPGCGQCPLRQLCHACKNGTVHLLPKTAPKKPKLQQSVCLLIVHSGGRVLLQRRPAKGLLAGLWQPLLFEEKLAKATAQKQLQQLLPGAQLTCPLPTARHIFTHRVWNLYGWQCTAPSSAIAPPGNCVFAPVGQLPQYALPSAFKAYMPFLAGAQTPASPKPPAATAQAVEKIEI